MEKENYPTWLHFLENFLLLFSICSLEHKLFITIWFKRENSDLQHFTKLTLESKRRRESHQKSRCPWWGSAAETPWAELLNHLRLLGAGSFAGSGWTSSPVSRGVDTWEPLSKATQGCPQHCPPPRALLEKRLLQTGRPQRHQGLLFKPLSGCALLFRMWTWTLK